MKNKVCIITGGSSGLGKGTAIHAARMGAKVVLLSRDNERGRKVFDEIRNISRNGNVDWIPADLSSIQSIKDFVNKFQSKYERLDVLFNCAGVQSMKRELTLDGLERNFATNYLGHFLLTNLLYDLLKAAVDPKVITISGSGHKRSVTEGVNGGTIDFNDLLGEKHFSFPKAAKQAVLAKILFTYELSRRWKARGIQVCTICPGLTKTNLVSELPWYVRSYMMIRYKMQNAMEPEEAAANIVKLVEFPDVNGKYFEGRRNSLKEVKSSNESYNLETAKRLWEVTEELIGQKFSYEH